MKLRYHYTVDEYIYDELVDEDERGHDYPEDYEKTIEDADEARSEWNMVAGWYFRGKDAWMITEVAWIEGDEAIARCLFEDPFSDFEFDDVVGALEKAIAEHNDTAYIEDYVNEKKEREREERERKASERLKVMETAFEPLKLAFLKKAPMKTAVCEKCGSWLSEEDKTAPAIVEREFESILTVGRIYQPYTCPSCGHSGTSNRKRSISEEEARSLLSKDLIESIEARDDIRLR